MRLYIFAAVLLISPLSTALAHQEKHHPPEGDASASESALRSTDVEVDAVSLEEWNARHHHLQIDPEAADENLRALTNDAHESIEVAHDHGKVSLARKAKTWVKNFNLRRVGINAIRWYQIQSVRPEAQSHALNLASLFLASHSIEMLSGPVVSLLAASQGASAKVVGAIATVGGIISIPGFDPLCIALFAAYPLKPVNRAVQRIRVATFRLVRKAGTKLKIEDWYRRNFTRIASSDLVANLALNRSDAESLNAVYAFPPPEVRANALQSQDLPYQDHPASVEAIERREILIRLPHHESPLVLRFRHGTYRAEDSRVKEAVFLESSTIPTAFQQDYSFRSRRALKQALKPFGFDVRDAVLHSLKLLATDQSEKLEHERFVHNVTQADDQSTHLEFEPFAVRDRHAVLGMKERQKEKDQILHKLEKRCRSILGGTD